jgi:hypothetical protein
LEFEIRISFAHNPHTFNFNFTMVDETKAAANAKIMAKYYGFVILFVKLHSAKVLEE